MCVGVYLTLYTYVCTCQCFYAHALGTHMHACKMVRKDIGAPLSWICGFSYLPLVPPMRSLVPWVLGSSSLWAQAPEPCPHPAPTYPM